MVPPTDKGSWVKYRSAQHLVHSKQVETMEGSVGADQRGWCPIWGGGWGVVKAGFLEGEIKEGDLEDG